MVSFHAGRVLRLFLCTSLLVTLALFARSADAESRRRKNSNEHNTQQPQDPMEIENSTVLNNPPPPQPPPPPPQHSSSSSQANNSENTAQPVQQPPTEKVGRGIASFKIGPSICLYNCFHEGSILLEIGYSVLPNKNAYLLLPIQFQFAPNGSVIMVPLGFQYDLAVPRVPGLYFYPRITMGYALVIDNLGAGSPTTHAGVFIPEFGVKYVYHGRFNIGGEFVSLPIIFGSLPTGNSNIYYRIQLSLGVNF